MNSYYRTNKGNHRHASWYCANGRRSIHTGDVIEIPAAEVAEWAPCEHCTDASEHAVHAEAQAKRAAEAPAKCDGRPAKPRWIKSPCTKCAHVGSSRAWRAHTPK